MAEKQTETTIKTCKRCNRAIYYLSTELCSSCQNKQVVNETHPCLLDLVMEKKD